MAIQPYGYAFSNPITRDDPSGLAPPTPGGNPVGWDPRRSGEPNLPCRDMKPKVYCYQCAFDYYAAIGLGALACQLANKSCGSQYQCDRDHVPTPVVPVTCPVSGRGTVTQPSAGYPISIGLVSIPDEFPWGNVLNPQGYCQGLCIAAFAANTTRDTSGPLGNWILTMCGLFCRTIRRVGCTAFGPWCEARGDKFTSKVCDVFWEESCIEPVEVE